MLLLANNGYSRVPVITKEKNMLEPLVPGYYVLSSQNQLTDQN